MHITEEEKEALKKLHTNLEEILSCSNATAISGFDYRGYLCCYCDSQHHDPAILKKHNIDNHKGSRDSIIPKFNKNRIDEYSVRLDITDLRCELCNTAIDTIEHLLEHLKSDHKRVTHTDIKNQIFPFKFNSESMTCYICSSVFIKFISLSQHMHTHYRNFICDECDFGFVTKGGLRRHISLHNKGVFKCNKCPKTFDSQTKANSHERIVHIQKGRKSKCGYCNEKFKNHVIRDNHLANVHGVKLETVKCHACDKTLPSTNALRVHIRRDHLMERRFKCTQCDKAFYQAATLKHHMVTHTGAREFKCTVCNKLYSRRETLRQHMEIHSNVRRFKCEHCGQAFVQKSSWKGHMKNRHGEVI